MIAIGRIGQVFGRDGFVKAFSYADLPERFEQLKTVYLDIDGEMRGFIIEDVRFHNRASLLKLKGVDSREAARFLVKKELWVPEEQQIELPERTYFVHDLIGLAVYSTAQQYLGKLTEVLQNAGNDIYVVTREESEILIPAVSEFITEVDLREKKMIVQLWEGMVE